MWFFKVDFMLKVQFRFEMEKFIEGILTATLAELESKSTWK